MANSWKFACCTLWSCNISVDIIYTYYDSDSDCDNDHDHNQDNQYYPYSTQHNPIFSQETAQRNLVLLKLIREPCIVRSLWSKLARIR